MNDELQKYKQYAEDVINEKVVSCRFIKLAAQRYLNWFERDDIEFRPDKADHVVNFIEKLKHFQQPFAGKPFLLEKWQKWFLYGIYGWYYTGTDNRVVKHVILDCGRKTGKSMLAAAMSLYAMIEGGYGIECDVVANTRAQAKILFDMCAAISRRMDPKKRYLRQTINRVKFDKTESFIQVLASEAASLDGYGSYFYVEDEFHAAPDTKLFDVLASSQGARHNPLSVIVTTAGYNLTGPYYTEIRKGLIDMLEGVVENDSLFGLIYTLDEGDDYHDRSVWPKVNPNLGITVDESYVQDRINNIKTNPLSEIDVITKTFNCWVQSKETWITDATIMKSFEKVELDKLKGELAFGGIDLASVSDMTAVSLMFPPNPDREYFPDKYIFYSRAYLPEDALVNSPNADFYKKAKMAKHLYTTPGNVCDFDFICRDLIDFNNDYILEKVAYDPYNSSQFVINAQDAGVMLEPFSQGLGNFNRCTKEFERLILSGKVVIDGNVVTRWCFANVVIKEDNNFNQKPIKSNKQQKIDVVISMLECLGIYLLSPRYCFSVEDNSQQ